MQNNTSDKTGEGIYRRAALSLDKITFNGNDGVFFNKDKDAQKDEKTGKFPTTQITKEGESLDVVFLKIRRVLSFFSKKGSMATSEHNHKGEMVTLYKQDGNITGIASQLREEYPMLKTQQIVFCWVPSINRIARVVVKGSSLGSEYKHETPVLKFYDYLQSFASNEHSHEFITKLTPVKEEGPQGDYCAINFVKGEKLDAEMLAKVNAMIDDIHERTSAIDARLNSAPAKEKEPKFTKKTYTKRDDGSGIPIIEEGKEDLSQTPDLGDDEDSSEVNVKDIPF